jgi:hypothetical protein
MPRADHDNIDPARRDGAEHGADAQGLDALAEQLRALGAESETERTVRRTVPWVASVMIHLGIVVLAMLIAGTVRLIQEEEAPIIVADFDAMSYEPVAALETAVEPVEQPNEAEPVTSTLTDDIERRLEALELAPIGLAADLNAPLPASGLRPGETKGQVTFVGLTSSNARRIAYVIDASGSLIASLQVVVEEMARSLEGLAPPQEFSIIFFQQDRALVVPPASRMLPARPEEKRRALEWIDRNVVPSGNSNPLPGIEAAIRLDPDVVFLLSDNITGAGQYEIDQRDLLARLDELNPRHTRSGRRRTQINCIQFLDPDPLDTLAIIAREHGGPRGYKYLDRRELGLSRP